MALFMVLLLVCLVGTIIYNIIICASWSESPLICGFTLKFVVLVINILSMAVMDDLNLRVGNDTVSIKLTLVGVYQVVAFYCNFLNN